MRNIIQDRGRRRRDGGRNWPGDGEKAPGRVSERCLSGRTGIKGREGIELHSAQSPLPFDFYTGSARKYYPTYRQTDSIYQTARDHSDSGELSARFNHRIPRIPLLLVDQIDIVRVRRLYSRQVSPLHNLSRRSFIKLTFVQQRCKFDRNERVFAGKWKISPPPGFIAEN